MNTVIRDTILSDYFEHYDLPHGQHGPAARHLRDCIDDALEKLRPQWRDIADAPKDGRWLIVAHEGQQATMAQWKVYEGRSWKEASCWTDAFGNVRDPTHWQPLPAPPVSRQQDGTT